MTTLKNRVLTALGEGPGTPAELAVDLAHPEPKVSRLCCWMKLQGYIRLKGRLPHDGKKRGRGEPIYSLLEHV